MKISFESLRNLAKNDWLKVILQIAGILISFFSLYFTFMCTVSPAELCLTTKKMQSMLSLKTIAGKNLELVFDGDVIKDPYFSQITIENPGFKTVKYESFAEDSFIHRRGLRLTADNPTCKLVACSVINLEPSNRVPPDVEIYATQKQSFDRSTIFIDAVSFNPRDKLTLGIISDGSPARISWRAHVTECNLTSKANTANYDDLWNWFFKVFQMLGTVLSYFMATVFILFIVCLWSLWVGLQTVYRNITMEGRIITEIGGADSAFDVLADEDKFQLHAKNLGFKTTDEKDRFRRDLGNLHREHNKKKLEAQSSAETAEGLSIILCQRSSQAVVVL